MYFSAIKHLSKDHFIQNMTRYAFNSIAEVEVFPQKSIKKKKKNSKRIIIISGKDYNICVSQTNCRMETK